MVVLRDLESQECDPVARPGAFVGIHLFCIWLLKGNPGKNRSFFVCKFNTDTLLRHIGKINLFDEGRLADGEKNESNRM
jgi:hypothetical protein